MNKKTGAVILRFGLVLCVLAALLVGGWWALQPPAFASLIGKDMGGKTALALTLPEGLDGLGHGRFVL